MIRLATSKIVKDCDSPQRSKTERVRFSASASRTAPKTAGDPISLASTCGGPDCRGRGRCAGRQPGIGADACTDGLRDVGLEGAANRHLPNLAGHMGHDPLGAQATAYRPGSPGRGSSRRIRSDLPGDVQESPGRPGPYRGLVGCGPRSHDSNGYERAHALSRHQPGARSHRSRAASPP